MLKSFRRFEIKRALKQFPFRNVRSPFEAGPRVITVQPSGQIRGRKSQTPFQMSRQIGPCPDRFIVHGLQLGNSDKVG